MMTLCLMIYKCWPIWVQRAAKSTLLKSSGEGGDKHYLKMDFPNHGRISVVYFFAWTNSKILSSKPRVKVKN